LDALETPLVQQGVYFEKAILILRHHTHIMQRFAQLPRRLWKSSSFLAAMGWIASDSSGYRARSTSV